jgi:ParB family chromosome partitioning protein
MSKKGLGRGFDSLIPTDVFNEEFDPTSVSDERISELRYLKISDIKPNAEQPRRVFDQDALEDLVIYKRIEEILYRKEYNRFAPGPNKWAAYSYLYSKYIFPVHKLNYLGHLMEIS